MPAAASVAAADLRVGSDGMLRWRGRAVPCALGQGGVRHDKREGDGATPAGTFALRGVLYRPDRLARPRTALSVRPLDPLDGWCAAPEHPAYNQPVRQPFAAESELLWRHDRVYDVIVPLGYNDAPVVPGRGSAIFLHVARENLAATAGCVALPLDDLLRVLGEITPATRLVIEG